jgi:hypothetical protein
MRQRGWERLGGQPEVYHIQADLPSIQVTRGRRPVLSPSSELGVRWNSGLLSDPGFCTTRPHGPGIAGRADGGRFCRASPLAMVHSDPFSQPSALPFAIRRHSLSFLKYDGFLYHPLRRRAGRPGAARRLPRASRRCWGVGQSGGTLVGPAVGDSGAVRFALRLYPTRRLSMHGRRAP